MELPPKKLRTQLVHVLRKKLCPMVTGPPGVGKSDIVHSITKEYNLKLIDLRLSQCDPTDMLGFPVKENGRMSYAPPTHFPLQGLDNVPSGYRGWLLFLDELPSASLAVQAAAYKVILDRQVGAYDLHKQVMVVGAGNEEMDGAIVNRMGTAMQSRLVHLQLMVSPMDWLEWAAQNSLDYRIMAYIEHRPEILHKFEPDHRDKTFACPRTWYFASKLIQGKKDIRDLLPALAGTVSEGVAREFLSYTTLCTKLPSIAQIKAAPASIDIDQEPSMLYAVSHMIAAYIDSSNAKELMMYVDRLPMEFGTITMQSAFKRNVALAKLPEVRNWRTTLANAIFS